MWISLFILVRSVTYLCVNLCVHTCTGPVNMIKSNTEEDIKELLVQKNESLFALTHLLI